MRGKYYWLTLFAYWILVIRFWLLECSNTKVGCIRDLFQSIGQILMKHILSLALYHSRMRSLFSWKTNWNVSDILLINRQKKFCHRDPKVIPAGHTGPRSNLIRCVIYSCSVNWHSTTGLWLKVYKKYAFLLFGQLKWTQWSGLANSK